MRACIVIPVHNEAESIGNIVTNLKRKPSFVVVVDDGSSDGSGNIAREKGAVVIRNDEKKGKGRSLQRGFEYVLNQNFDCVITMDGDGQHDVDDIEQFLKQAKVQPLCIITGNRMQDHQGMPRVRLWTNRLMSALISMVCRQRIPDTQCGFRLIPCAVLKELTLFSSDFEIETEVLIKASKKNFKITSVPIKTIYRDELSKINPVIDTFRFIVYIIKEMWTSKS